MAARRILKIKRTNSGRLLLTRNQPKKTSHKRSTPTSELRCRRHSTYDSNKIFAPVSHHLLSSTTIGRRSLATVSKRKKDDHHVDGEDDDDITVQRSNKRMKRCHHDDDLVDMTKKTTTTGMYFSPDYTVVVSFL